MGLGEDRFFDAADDDLGGGNVQGPAGEGDDWIRNPFYLGCFLASASVVFAVPSWAKGPAVTKVSLASTPARHSSAR